MLAGKLNFNQLQEHPFARSRSTHAPGQSRWLRLARVQALADFGDETDFRAAYSLLSRELHDWQKKTIVSRG